MTLDASNTIRRLEVLLLLYQDISYQGECHTYLSGVLALFITMRPPLHEVYTRDESQQVNTSETRCNIF